jgi:hypothetical protein
MNTLMVSKRKFLPRLPKNFKRRKKKNEKRRRRMKKKRKKMTNRIIRNPLKIKIIRKHKYKQIAKNKSKKFKAIIMIN